MPYIMAIYKAPKQEKLVKEAVGIVWHHVRQNAKKILPNEDDEWPKHHLLCECRRCQPTHFKYRTKTLTKTRKKK